MADAERDGMRRALELAGRGWGRVAPNPMVGAVVLRGEDVVGEGWHAEYGGPHAEVAALQMAGEAARGATLVVTLEPCTHHGRTPPCTEAIVAAGIARVVYACADPNRAAAGGADRLRAAGITVVEGPEAEATRALNAPFFHRHERGVPFVALKLALSLDARVSDSAAAPAEVTGPVARAEAHRLRAGHDAVVVGIGTALADDPWLTVREAPAPRTPPHRVVLDSRARLPRDARLVDSVAEAPVWLFHTPAAPAGALARLAGQGVRTRCVAPGPAGVAWNEVLAALAEESIAAILVEGGGRVAASLLAEDRADRMHLFYAPKLYGNAGAPGFPGTGFPRGWELGNVSRLDRDVLLTVERTRGGEAG